jgi:hypothetical protein
LFFCALWNFHFAQYDFDFALLMTLLAWGYLSKQLIKPIEIASRALRSYKKERQVPDLP